MVSKINEKAFHHGSLFFFSLITKGTEKNCMLKYIQYVHNFTVVPKYKNLFLHINVKLVPFAPNLPVHSLSLISMLVGILWSSKTFVKTLRHWIEPIQNWNISFEFTLVRRCHLINKMHWTRLPIFLCNLLRSLYHLKGINFYGIYI